MTSLNYQMLITEWRRKLLTIAKLLVFEDQTLEDALRSA